MTIHWGSENLLSIGDRVRSGTYHACSRFCRAVNFCDGERIAAVVAPEIGEGPINLVVEHLDPTFPHTLRITRDGIEFGSHRVPRRRVPVYDSGLALTPLPSHVSPASERVAKALSAWTDVLVDVAPPASLVFLLDRGRMALLRPGFERTFAERVAHCVDDLYSGDLVRGVSGLKGCGFGLTPSGDDFLAGFLIGLNVVEALHGRNLHSVKRRIYDAARSRNRLSDAMLLLARDGRVPAKVKNLLGTLFHSVNGANRGPMHGPHHAIALAMEESTRDLCTVGATSGADLATGLLMTLRVGLTGHPLSCTLPAGGTGPPEASAITRRETATVLQAAGSPAPPRSTIGAVLRGGASWS